MNEPERERPLQEKLHKEKRNDKRQNHSVGIVIIVIPAPPRSPLALATLQPHTALEVLLAAHLHLHLLDIHALLRGNDRPQLAAAHVLHHALRLTLLGVLLVESLLDVAAVAGGLEEGLVKLLGLLALGERQRRHLGRERGGIIDLDIPECRHHRYAAVLGQMGNVVELGVELGAVNAAARRRLAVEELAVDVVLEDVTDRTRLIGLTETLGHVATVTGIGVEKLVGSGNAGAAFLERPGLDLDTVDGLKEGLGNAAGDDGGGAGVLAHLINGQDTVADELGLGVGEVGEDETGTIAKEDVVAEVDGLEMLRLAGSGGDGHLLGADESVDGGRFTDVGITDETDLELAICGKILLVFVWFVVLSCKRSLP